MMRWHAMRRRWLSQRGSQSLQAAGAALAAALIVVALLGGAGQLGSAVKQAYECAAATLTGGGGCATQAVTTPTQDSPPWWEGVFDNISSWVRQFSPPTGDQIAADPAVQAALEAAWQRSDVSSYDRRHEEGGWIVWNRRSGEYRIVNVPPGSRAALGTIGTPPTVGSDEQVVAFFHTHPNPSPTDERGTSWGQGPSAGDIGFADYYKIPGILRNYDGVVVFGPRAR